LHAAIIEARKQGASLRAIRKAAGVPHTYVEKIVSKAQSEISTTSPPSMCRDAALGYFARCDSPAWLAR
jgi:hypothetical protein